MMVDIEGLIDRLQKAAGLDRESDAKIARDIMNFEIHDWPNWIVSKSSMHDFPAIHPTPHYTVDLSVALFLIPAHLYYTVRKGRTRTTEALYGCVINDHGIDIAKAETDASAALAVCIAAVRLRVG